MCTVGCEEDNHWHSRSVNTVSAVLLFVLLESFVIC